MQMLIGPTVVILDMQHLQSITEGSQFFSLLKSLHVRVACIPADPYTRRIKGKESTSSQSSAASELTHWGHPRLFPHGVWNVLQAYTGVIPLRSFNQWIKEFVILLEHLFAVFSP